MNEGDYIRYKIQNKYEDIVKIGKVSFIGVEEIQRYNREPRGELYCQVDNDFRNLYAKDIIKSSPNIIDLIEYMDLLELEQPVKLYDTDTTIGLFNPVRCDGFTTFEDGTHCIILNMDYIVDIKNLKIKSVLTHEQFDEKKYKVGD